MNVLILQKIKDVKQELEQYKEHLSLAEFEITRVKQKNRELEDANEKLEQRLERLALLQQQPNTIVILL
jgi:chromosome segregation ATPase